MKKIKDLLFITLATLVLGSCASTRYEDHSLSFEENESFPQGYQKGTLSNFNLLSPSDNDVISAIPTFTWEASSNAITYTLEVCTEESFVHDSIEISYIKETNITSTHFTLSAPLKAKNVTYYWRVIAVNDFNSKDERNLQCNNVFSFFYESLNSEEIPFDIGDESDWQLHKDGSYADISVDRTNFFNNEDPNSLSITFDKEHTKQGDVMSDGWIVVTKTVEKELYGTDAIMFNFYYSGNDADILLRLVDADGEYWYNKIKVSQNAKQRVLMEFSEFTLRTKDTLVQNEVFNYEHIQFIEIVFERCFGDGVCLAGNFKAVNYESYSDLFIKKLDFNSFAKEEFIYESYHFDETISEDGSELSLGYITSASGDNAKGIGSYGYGFTKLLMNRYFANGNALRLKVKYSGYYSTSCKVYIRIYEEDTDRWSYEQPFSALTKDEFVELTIPFAAFAKSEIRGDGNRQFYYILQLQLGGGNLYGNGSITFKDLEIVTIPDISTNRKVVDESGLIDDFDSYTFRTQIYEHWESSIENKDEGIFLNQQERFVNASNVNCGQFNYKADMSMATYDTYLNVNYTGGNAIKFWLKDGSQLKTGDGALNYLNPDDVCAAIVFQLALKDGRWYRYEIRKSPKYWTEYIINFDDFDLYSGVETSESDPFISENIVNFAFGLQYFYYTENGTPHPVYVESNPVYLDSIMFVKSDVSKVSQLEKEITPDIDNPKNISFDNFEYASTDDLRLKWFGINQLDFENIELSNEVSNEGDSHSMKLDYKGATSPSYATYPRFGSSCQAKAMCLDIKGDGVCTIYINIYIKIGTTTKQYRATLFTVSSAWNRYVIGFDKSNFKSMDNDSSYLDINSITQITRITFGIVNSSSDELSSIYIDNMKFTTDVKSFTVKTVTPIN